MKRCSACRETKPLSEFYRNARRAGGRNNQCKVCQGKSTKKYYAAKGHKTQRAWWLNKKYGITEEHRTKLLAWSNGGCAICGLRPEAENAKLDIDHNHQTGKVRGILCRSCNLALGMFKDNKHLLRVATAYLEYFDDEA